MATSVIFLMQIKSDLNEKSVALRADSRSVSLFNEVFNTMRQYDVCMSYFHNETFIDGQLTNFPIDSIHTDGKGGKDLLTEEGGFIDENETLKVKDISVEARGKKVYLVMIFERIEGAGLKEVKREFAVNVKRNANNVVYDCFDIGVNIRRTVRAKTCQGYDEVGVLDTAADGSFECKQRIMPPAVPEQECIAEFDDFNPNGGFIHGMNLVVDPAGGPGKVIYYSFDCVQKGVKPKDKVTKCPSGQVPIGFTDTGLKCKTIEPADIGHIFVSDDDPPPSSSTTGSSSGGGFTPSTLAPPPPPPPPPPCPEPAQASCGDNACIVETGLTLNPSTGCYSSFCNLIEPVIDCVNQWQSQGVINVPIPVPESSVDAATTPDDPAGRGYSHHLTCECGGPTSKTCPEKFVGVNVTPPNECGVKCNDPNVSEAVEGEIQYRPKAVAIPNGNCVGAEDSGERVCAACSATELNPSCNMVFTYTITKPQGECGTDCPEADGSTRTESDGSCDCNISGDCPDNTACVPACGVGETCVSGSCIPQVCSPNCKVGEVCEGGSCVPDPTCSPACSLGEVCNAGVCEADGSCSPACAVGEICNAGTCEPDGSCSPACALGEVCNAGTCEPDGSCSPTCDPLTEICNAGTCEWNGQCASPPCCYPDCSSGQTCQASGSGGDLGSCVGCGNIGDVCCPGDVCSTGECSGGTCIDCGDSGQVCCGGTNCNSPLECQGGTCGDCGATGQACCGGVGGSCGDSNAFCDNGTCNPCGAEGQACCAGSCGSGLSCNSNICEVTASVAACGGCTDSAECIDGSCSALGICTPASGDLCECPSQATAPECLPVCSWNGAWKDTGTCTAGSGAQGIEQERTCVEEDGVTSCGTCTGTTTTQCIENPSTCPTVACPGVQECNLATNSCENPTCSPVCSLGQECDPSGNCVDDSDPTTCYPACVGGNLFCQNDSCVVCGLANSPCCPSAPACSMGSSCQSGTCVADGGTCVDRGGDCSAGQTCCSGMTCIAGSCDENNSCTATYTCPDGTDVTCPGDKSSGSCLPESISACNALCPAVTTTTTAPTPLITTTTTQAGSCPSPCLLPQICIGGECKIPPTEDGGSDGGGSNPPPPNCPTSSECDAICIAGSGVCKVKSGTSCYFCTPCGMCSGTSSTGEDCSRYTGNCPLGCISDKC